MKAIIKHFISIAFVTIMFIASYMFFRYILIDDTVSYTRIAMHQFYDQDNIDILFLGSSHCYRSLNPAVTDRIFEANTFNGGSSAQEMDGSYAIAREAVKCNNIKQIYLEMLYSVAEAKPHKSRTQLTSTYIISDYMHTGINRISYLLNASSKEYYINSFFIPLRNRTKITDLNYIKDLIKKKQSYEYKNYSWNRDNDTFEYYEDKGFVANDDSLLGKEIWVSPYYPKTFDSISEEWRKDVKKIAKLCKQHNIKLTLFVSPLPEWSVLCMENYDDYKAIVSELAKECNVEYYDFNYIDSSLFDSSNPEYYKDNGHLNTAGAEAFSRLFANIMTGKISNKEIMYGTIHDKTFNEEPRFLGLSKLSDNPDSDSKNEDDFEKPEKGSDTQNEIKVKLVSNKQNMEYRISVRSESGHQALIRDFSSDKFVSLPLDNSKRRVIIIEWRMPESPLEIHTKCFTY